MKFAMHNWMRAEPIETTIARLGRSGYDAIEISGEPSSGTPTRSSGLLDKHGFGCWGRDPDDRRPRPAARGLLRPARLVDYVKDTISQIAAWGGEIITIVPSTVGKVVPMGSPEDEWKWAVEALKQCQAHGEEIGVRIGLEPLNRFETYFLNRADQALGRSPRTSAATAASASTSST